MNISTAILAIIGIAFIFQMISPNFTEAFVFVPAIAFAEPWRFISSMFLHGGYMHIFFNAYALFLFGSILERKLSKSQFLTLYFVAGLVGGLAYYMTYILGIIPSVPALGASGAIYGILGACAVMFPNMRIFVYFIPMKMKYAAVLWVALELFGSFNINSGIASAAHLGGLVFGLAFAWYVANKQREEEMPPDPWQD